MASSYSESQAVAEDFRMALEDIQTNARAEIANLTLIARENTEHALEISGALVDHINKIAPHKKLPNLYLLDSIVKNVGTPYTIFFSRKLYKTFMESYALVDGATRRKMEEMLKTWKEPVPGSIDTRPVFPPDVVRPIENALIKYRTTVLQQDQERMRSQQHMLGRGRPMQGVPYRETPTPPGTRPPSQAQGGFPVPLPMPNTNGIPYSQAPPAGAYNSQMMFPAPSTSTPTPQPPAASSAFQPPRIPGYGMPQAGISIDSLSNDIQQLITASQAQVSHTPHDPSIQTRLKALMDLQSILQTQNLPQDQLVLVKNQIADLAVTIRATPAQPPTPVPTAQPVAVAPPPAAAPKVSLESLLGPGALAAIMARNSVTPQPPTPQPPPVSIAVRPATPQRSETPQSAAPATDPMALMSMLRRAGMLPSATPTTGSQRVGTTPSSSVPLPFPLPIPGGAAMTGAPAAARPPTPLAALTNDISLKASSLKQFRPHLLPLLFEGLGTQCTQCGRRFTRDAEGREKKTAHMDWHFRVNQRISDVEKRGQHRSWLVDEVDWTRTRETVDGDHTTPAGEHDGGGSAGAAAHDGGPGAAAGEGAGRGGSGPTGGSRTPSQTKEYIPVPDDPMLAASVCPVCQEKFETRWLDGAQEFVWEDAARVGDRIYHASCHREATRDGGSSGGGGGGDSGGGGGGTPMYTRGAPTEALPVPVLGKRKAEDELTSLRGKPKMEAA
ncbi:hypothetical protein GGR56DRAFT_371161 [Xylariaceae sp. FL0804]|nr:hypothetical protein GGR56DRAFT_371161 [Xylariaceae sp. FL0804]